MLQKILDKIIRDLSSVSENNEYNKIVIVLIFSLIGLIFTVVFSIISIFEENYILFGILLFVSMIYMLNFFTLRRSPDSEPFSHILLITYGLLLIYLLLGSSTLSTGSIWFASFPIVTLFVYGLKRGSLYSIVFLVLGVGLIIGVSFFQNVEGYSTAYMIRFIAFYILVFIILYAFEYTRQNYLKKLERSVLDAEKNSRMKDEFISQLSHQIRTPLNNIMVISDLVQDSDISTKEKDLIDTIVASTQNLVNVVNNIVKVSNVDIRNNKQNRVSFNLYSTIDNTLKLFGKDKERKLEFNLRYIKEIQENLIGDPIRLKQIFINLIENILKCYNKDKIKIDISVNFEKGDRHTSKLNFNIHAQNIGVITADEEGNYYVQNNFKEDNNKRDEEALVNLNYLDFTIAKKIVQMHKGDFIVHVGQNTLTYIFSISLEVDHEREAKQHVEPSKTPKIELPGSDKKIELKDANVLLVEDNLINQKIVILSLKTMVKNVDVANNGKEALDMFGTSKYNIILMDVQMPVMDGIVATKKIRELEASSNAHTPIIAITANALAGDKENCLAAGMNDYISKPFQIEVLLQKMKNLLS